MSNQMEDISNVLNMSSKSNEKQSIRIETQVLEPQQVSDTDCVFNIPSKGILDRGSRVLLPVYMSNGDQRLGVLDGAYGFIERATMRTSDGVVIAQTDDANYLMSIRNQFNPQGIRERKQFLMNGVQNVYELGTSSGTAQNGRIQIKGEYTGANGDTEARYRMPTTNTYSEQPVYSIKLAELFPESLTFQIPVFLLKGQLQLVLRFTNTGRGGFRNTAVTSAGNVANVNFNTSKIKFVSDHIYFDSSTMSKLESQANGKQGIVIPYGDFNTIKMFLKSPNTGLGAGASAEQEYRKNIGLSGLRVRYMLLHKGEIGTNNDHTNGQLIMGKTASVGCEKAKGESYNVIINNRQYYPVDIEMDSMKYTELEDVYGVPMSCPRPCYSNVGNVNDAKGVTDGNTGGGVTGADANLFGFAGSNLLNNSNFYGKSQALIGGSSNVIGINFSSVRGNVPNSGIKVGQVPVEIKYKNTFTNHFDFNRNLRVFVCVERVMVIKNGQIFTTYS